MKKLALIFVAFSFCLIPSQNTSAADLYSLSKGEFDANSKKERNEIAFAFIKEIQKIDSYLPTPKPSEVEWVNIEEKAIEKINKENQNLADQRLIGLLNSAEYTHINFKKMMGSIIEAFEMIMNNDIALKKEIFYWGKITTFFNYFGMDSLIRTLIDEKRLPQNISESTLIGPAGNRSIMFNKYANDIIMHIVVPYLDDKITE